MLSWQSPIMEVGLPVINSARIYYALDSVLLSIRFTGPSQRNELSRFPRSADLRRINVAEGAYRAEYTIMEHRREDFTTMPLKVQVGSRAVVQWLK